MNNRKLTASERIRLARQRKARLNALRLSEEASSRDYDRIMRSNRSVCG